MRFLIVLALLALPVFCIWTAFKAYRSPIRHPILWALVCTLCAPVTSIDLNSGRISAQLFWILIFGVGYAENSREGTALLQIAFPAGAALFLTRRRRLMIAHRPMLPDDQLQR
jgi:hypothetical protein